MITANEARNAIATKHGHKDWETARYRMGADDLNELMIEAMEYYASQSNSHKHVVMQGLPTESDISAAGLNLTEHLETEPMIRDMAKRYFRQGARWAISKLSSSPTVASEGQGEANTCAGGSKCVDIEIEEGYYQCEKCGRTSRG